MKQRLSILGSTGSIGVQTLDIVAENPDLFEVTSLAAGSNWELLARQAIRFDVDCVVIADTTKYEPLRQALASYPIKVYTGSESLSQIVRSSEVDVVVNALVGYAGLHPTIAAIKAGKKIALANKETLVCAGELVMAAAEEHGAEIIPVDSEHSAIFQCLLGNHSCDEIKRLILTCSGGPFFGMSREEIEGKTKADALKHPNWAMGAKITIDSATLMNKGLEFIEAMRLFRVTPDQVSVVIHRQSIIHSMVEFVDGAVMAQMGTPDMRLPIRLALTYPARGVSTAEPLDLLKCPPLTFHEPDLEAFPALRMAMECARIGGTSCAILNGANEEAVGAFLRDEISFGQIPVLVEKALREIEVKSNPSLEDILEADRLARRVVCESR